MAFKISRRLKEFFFGVWLDRRAEGVLEPGTHFYGEIASIKQRRPRG
jgi:hypothetical protein